jgi:hypothetical protein
MIEELHAEAHKLHRAGLPITLCPPGSKKPLGDGWDAKQDGKAWQKKSWTLKEIDRAFKVRGELNPGVLYGPRSGLVDIEYDSGDGEAALGALFDGDVPVAPMFRSKRSPHRIVKFDDDLNRINRATVHFGDLEIKLGCNGLAAHSLWPPAVTGGTHRAWVGGLAYYECDPPAVSQATKERLFERALSDFCKTAGEGREKSSSGTQRPQKLHEICVSTAPSEFSVYPSPKKIKPSPAIQKAVAMTLPTRSGIRHRCIFSLARHLKAIPELANADDDSLRRIVEWWHEVALPVITTKAFEETWFDFRNAWRAVKFPAGKEPIAMMYATAISRPMPKCAEKYEQTQLRCLVALCRELQQEAGDDPFYLAGRIAAEHIGVDHKTAARWLRMLCMDDVLRLHERGTRHSASEYHYLGD